MDYDEKMKLLVALKDNPNESSAIIDTFPFSQSVAYRHNGFKRHIKKIVKMCMRACKWSTTPLIFATEREINSQVNLIFILKYFIIYVLDTFPYHNY